MNTDTIPKYSEVIPLQGLSTQEFLVLALEATSRLHWPVNHISEAGIMAHTNNGLKDWNAVISIYIEGDVAVLTSTSANRERVDLGRNHENVHSFRVAFHDVSAYFTSEDLNIKYQELAPTLSAPDYERLRPAPAAPPPPARNIRSFFIPTEGYFMTPILIAINIILFIAMCATGVDVLTPDSASLLKWGANFRPLTLDGQWWRLLTCCFLHIGVIHLLMNMYALFFIGLLLEPFLGKMRFLVAYLLTGITASITSLWWHDITISAGASGAVFGMYGLFLALLTTNFIDRDARKPLLSSIGIFVGYNLLYGMKSGIDNAAHIGGLLSGLVIGYTFVPGLKKPDKSREVITTILLCVVILAGTAAVYRSLPNDFKRYTEQMERFTRNEMIALSNTTRTDSSKQDDLLRGIDSSIHYWENNVQITRDIAGMKLPAAYKQRNDLILKYAQLRLDYTRVLRKREEEQTYSYDSLLTGYDRQIDATIKLLNKNGE